LAALRVELLRRMARLDGRALLRLRGEAALARITADVDALEGIVLRLALPALAAAITHAAVFAALLGLVGWPVAVTVLAACVPPGTLVLVRLARRGRAPSEAAEAGQQALGRGLIDALRDREAL